MDLDQSEIRVTFNDKPLFVWHGGTVAVTNILQEFAGTAANAGMPTEALAQVCLLRPDLVGHREIDRETQMMGITWLVLTAPTNNPEHPGRVADYINTTDFEVSITVDKDEEKFELAILATPWAGRA
jgi:hypothetical protein